jgi:hypothetical protein
MSQKREAEFWNRPEFVPFVLGDEKWCEFGFGLISDRWSFYLAVYVWVLCSCRSEYFWCAQYSLNCNLNMFIRNYTRRLYSWSSPGISWAAKRRVGCIFATTHAEIKVCWIYRVTIIMFWLKLCALTNSILECELCVKVVKVWKKVNISI